MLPDEAVADGLELVPCDAAELDACELGVEGGALVGVDGDLVTLDLIVLVGLGDEVAQGVPAVLAAFVLPGALTLEVADAVVLAPLLAGLLLVSLLAGLLLVSLLAGLLLVSLLAGLLLVSPLAGLDTEGAGGAFVLTDLLVLVAVGAEEAGEHVVAVALGWEMLVLLAWPMPPFEPMPPFDEPSGVPGPVWFCGAALLGEVIPTC